MLAAEGGHAEFVESLLKVGAAANTSSETGATAPIAAASQPRSGTVRHLLAAGADVNARTRTGKTALMTAAEIGHREIADPFPRGGRRGERQDRG